MRRRTALAMGALATCAPWGFQRAAGAATWPVRPLRLIVVYPVGGVSDALARALALKLSQRIGMAVHVENRAGLGGSLGMDLLAKAPPDGHTLAFSAISPLTTTPHMTRTPYDPLRDVEPVIGVMLTPVLLVGTPAFAGKDFQDLVALGRSGRSLRWATSGLATTGHLVLEGVRLATRADIMHVPYKGGGQQLNDALAGQFELLSTNMGELQLQYVREGRFKPLAVGSPARLRRLPDVPTFAEVGSAAANLSSRFGIFAPARTSGAMMQRLNTVFNELLQSADIQSLLLSVDNTPTGGTAADFADVVQREWELNRRLALAGRLKAE